MAPGDCLFASVATLMRDEPDAPSAGRLRAIVAESVLSPANRATVDLWADIARCAKASGDAAMLRDYAHALPLADARLPRAQALILVRTRMLMPAYYWGDEYALRTLSRALGVGFVVVSRRADGARRRLQIPDGRAAASVGAWAFLWFAGDHYSPLDNALLRPRGTPPRRRGASARSRAPSPGSRAAGECPS